jgi:DNA-binding NarL/FixJ family response regulator
MGRWRGLDDLVIVAVLEDSEVLKQGIKSTLEKREFLVLTPECQEDCLDLLSKGCRAFVLDIGLDENARRVEGLKTLEAIKEQVSSAFCAVITHQDKAKYKPIAKNLGADWFSGKSTADINGLIERMEIEFLRRRFLPTAEPTLSDLRQRTLEIGLEVRRESLCSLDSAETLVDRIRRSATSVLDTLSAGDRELAEDELVLMEPDIRQLLSLKSELGDGYGIVIAALWRLSISRAPG